MLGHVWYLNLKLKYMWPREKGTFSTEVEHSVVVQHGSWGPPNPHFLFAFAQFTTWQSYL